MSEPATLSSPKIVSVNEPGLHARIIHRATYDDLSLVLLPVENESPLSMFQRLQHVLTKYNVQVIRQSIFGAVHDTSSVMHDLEEACGSVDWPVTWIEGGSCTAAPLAGAIVRAVSGMEITRLSLDGRPIGALLENHTARYCHLADIRANDTSASRSEQARQTFDNMEAALEMAGMTMTDVVRTWLCMDDILDWYDDLNKVRTAFFERTGVFKAMVPASTGIGGHNAAGAAMIADVLALQPKQDDVRVFPVPSPLQCPALDYGSSFARAVEVETPDYRWLYVSGTASIDPDGHTMFVGDMDKQVRQTFDVVEAILESRDMTLDNVTRGIAYCKYAKDAPIYTAYCEERGLTNLPVIVAESAVCRDDLLFEIQVDGVKAKG
jgi:enamine deaminase RidA (YjgF/YER057c/UK114 family)